MAKQNKKQNNELDLKKMEGVSGGSTRVNADGNIEVLQGDKVIGTFSKDQARQALDFNEVANGFHSKGDFKPWFGGPHHHGPFHRGH